MKNQLFALGMAMTASMLAVSVSWAAPSSMEQVIIVNSGDHATPGYRVTLQADGTLQSVLVPRRGQAAIRRRDQLIPANRKRFFTDLAQAEPLAALPANTLISSATRRRGRRQARTASAPISGVQVFVIYQGHQSPNLRQASSDAGKRLYQDVKQALNVLRLPIPDLP